MGVLCSCIQQSENMEILYDKRGKPVKQVIINKSTSNKLNENRQKSEKDTKSILSQPKEQNKINSQKFLIERNVSPIMKINIDKSHLSQSNNTSGFVSKDDKILNESYTNLENTNIVTIDEDVISDTYLQKEFKFQLFELINEARTKPLKFIKRVLKIKEKLKCENDAYFIDKNEKILQRINFIKALSCFDDLLANLKTILPLPSFLYSDDLEIQVDEINFTKREILTEQLTKQSKELGQKYKNFGFHFDSDIKDSELSFILQMVDDSSFRGKRRANILSHNFNSIGISHSNIDRNDKFFIYIVFAQNN